MVIGEPDNLGGGVFLAAHCLRAANRAMTCLSPEPIGAYRSLLSNQLFTVATDLFLYSSPRGVDKSEGHEPPENKSINLPQRSDRLLLVSRYLRQHWRLDRFLFLFFFGLIDRLSGRVHKPRGHEDD
jgi:hypothetical protein